MDIKFLNSENSETSTSHRLQTSKHIKRSYKINKFKFLTPTRNEKFELPDGSYSVSDIEDYLKISSKNNPPIKNMYK